MRLIDADALKDTLLKYHYTTEHNQIFRYIDEQQTAYSVDKVVEQLEKLPKGSAWNHNSDNIDRKKTIEIVKGGGVDDN